MPKPSTEPLTYEDLRAMVPKIEARLESFGAQTEAEGFTAQGLAPMTPDEALELLADLGQVARDRPWTAQELFHFEQLLSVYRMAVQAFTLGYKGRWFTMLKDSL